MWSSLAAVDEAITPSAPLNAAADISLIPKAVCVSMFNPSLIYPGFSTSYTRFFNLADLPYYTTNVSFLFGNIGISASHQFLDHPLYREHKSTLAFSRHFNELSIGIALRNIYSEASGYHENNVLGIDVGTSWDFHTLTTAFILKNATHTKFYEDPLPIVYIWEQSFRLTENSALAFAVEKEMNYDFSFKFATAHHFSEHFSLYAGYIHEPARLSVGAQFSILPYQVTYSFRTHQYLDLTHFVSLAYVFEND
jgi:hypothetical protein